MKEHIIELQVDDGPVHHTTVPVPDDRVRHTVLPEENEFQKIRRSSDKSISGFVGYTREQMIYEIMACTESCMLGVLAVFLSAAAAVWSPWLLFGAAAALAAAVRRLN